MAGALRFMALPPDAPFNRAARPPGGPHRAGVGMSAAPDIAMELTAELRALAPAAKGMTADSRRVGPAICSWPSRQGP
jgi:hypothetical protein